MSLMQLSRSRISPKRVTAALLCSRRMFAAGAQSSASPGDAFAAQLQSKTERELLELLERRNQPANQAPEAAESQAKGTEAQVRQASFARAEVPAQPLGDEHARNYIRGSQCGAQRHLPYAGVYSNRA